MNMHDPTNPVQRLIVTVLNAMFQRKETDPWSYNEMYCLAEVSERPSAESELVEIQQFYARQGRMFAPHSVLKLLENWTGTLDRARMPAEQTRTEEEQKRDRAAVDMAVPKLPRNWMEL